MDNRLCSSRDTYFFGTSHTLEIHGTDFKVHHATAKSFAIALNSGCPLCRPMWTQSNSSTSSCSENLWTGVLLEFVRNAGAAHRRIELVEMAQPGSKDCGPGAEMETLMAKYRVYGELILVRSSQNLRHCIGTNFSEEKAKSKPPQESMKW